MARLGIQFFVEHSCSDRDGIRPRGVPATSDPRGLSLSEGQTRPPFLLADRSLAAAPSARWEEGLVPLGHDERPRPWR